MSQLRATSDPPLSLPGALRRGLDAVRSRLRLALFVRGAGVLAAGLSAAVLVSFALDRGLLLAWGTRAAILALALVGLGLLAWRRLARPLRTPLPDVELARAVERVTPAFEWRLVSAVQFADPAWAPGETSRALAAEVVADAERIARGVALEGAVPLRSSLRAASKGALCLTALLVLAGTFQASAATWLRRNVLLSRSAEWPRATTLSLAGFQDGVLRVAEGDDVVLEVQATGEVPRRVRVELSVDPLAEPDPTGDEAGRDAGPERLLMDDVSDPAGSGAFRATLERVSRSVNLTIAGGDHRLGPFRVEVLRRPWIEELVAELRPPAHTGLPVRRLVLASADLAVPAGTEVLLEGRASKPLVEAFLSEQAGVADVTTRHAAELGPFAPPIAPTTAPTTAPGGQAGAPRAFRVLLRADGTARYVLDVRDGDDLGLAEPMAFNLVARPDAPPTVRLEVSGVGLSVTSTARIPYRITAEDDHGLVEGALAVKLVPAAPQEDAAEGAAPEATEPREERRALAALSGTGQGEASGALELAAFELAPGASITLWGEGRDADPLGPNTGTSPALQLRVVPPDKLLNELLRRLFEQRQQLERMIEEERRLAQGLAGADLEVLRRAPATQEDVRRVVERAAEVVAGVVEELANNDLLDPTSRERLTVQVGEPLSAAASGLARDALAAAEEALRAEEPAREAAMRLAARSATELAVELRAIVERMGRLEAMAELVAQLKRLIRAQRDLMERTRAASAPSEPR